MERLADCNNGFSVQIRNLSQPFTHFDVAIKDILPLNRIS